jgi:TRAP-type C4-dicarboxylate transport system permease small subunit
MTADRLLVVLLGTISGGMLLGMAGVTLLDVAGRAVFNRPIPAAYELVQLAQAILVFAALPLATRRREHITMGVSLGALGSRAAAALAVLVDLVSIGFLAVLAWRLRLLGLYLDDMGEALMFLGVPVAPMAQFMAAMTALSALVLGIVALRDLRHGRRDGEEFAP